MGALYVTGTGTDVGKTYVTAALARALRARGVAVDVLKPVVSGFDLDHPEGSDPWVLIEACGREPTCEEIERTAPLRFRAPQSPPLAARMEGRSIEATDVVALCRERIAATRGLLLIEGAGGVMSPVDDRTTGLDVIGALGIPVLLVTGSYLGTISHTLTALEVLQAREVVVSESAPPSPDLAETCKAIASLSGARVTALKRGAGFAGAHPLVDRIAVLTAYAVGA